MKTKVLVFSVFDVCLLFGLVAVLAGLIVIPFFDDNNRAILAMALKKYEKAEQEWRNILNEDSFSSFYRMNLGLNYILFDKSDKSIQEYEITRNLLKAEIPYGNFKVENQNQSRVSDENKNAKPLSELKDTKQKYKDDILFYSFFNSAVAGLQKGEVKTALGFYQKALGVYPHSLEVKTNIELLVQDRSSSGEETKDDKSKKDQKKDQEKENSSGSSGDKEEGKEEKENESEKEGKQSKEEKKSDKKDEMKEQGEEGSKEKENQKNAEGKEGDEKDQDSFEQARQERSDNKQNVNKTQKEAILKAILEQEKKIRERRHKEKRTPSPIEKDW